VKDVLILLGQKIFFEKSGEGKAVRKKKKFCFKEDLKKFKNTNNKVSYGT